MFVSIIIIAFSLMLFLYWFRYTCLLILNTKTVKDYTAQIATANQLEFPAIQAQLRLAVEGTHLDTLHSSLDRDYQLVTGLLRHAAQFQVGGVNIEQRMLMIDYKVMKAWYSMSRTFTKANYATQALQEMSDIVAHFANSMGERSASASRA
jgi:hypothetical protein